jgi:hypothetical protein
MVSSKEEVGDKDRGRGWGTAKASSVGEKEGDGMNSESLIQVERSSMGGLYASKKTLPGGANS